MFQACATTLGQGVMENSWWDPKKPTERTLHPHLAGETMSLQRGFPTGRIIHYSLMCSLLRFPQMRQTQAHMIVKTVFTLSPVKTKEDVYKY